MSIMHILYVCINSTNNFSPCVSFTQGSVFQVLRTGLTMRKICSSGKSPGIFHLSSIYYYIVSVDRFSLEVASKPRFQLHLQIHSFHIWMAFIIIIGYRYAIGPLSSMRPLRSVNLTNRMVMVVMVEDKTIWVNLARKSCGMHKVTR